MEKTLAELQNHWLWQDKPFAKGQAWVDLLFLSINTPTQTIYRNKIYQLELGQIMASENELCTRWGWSRTKLRSFLRLLTETSMVELVRDKGKTIITIPKHSSIQIEIPPQKPLEKQNSIQELLQVEVQLRIQEEKQPDTLQNQCIAKIHKQLKKTLTRQEKGAKSASVNTLEKNHENTLRKVTYTTQATEPYQLSILDAIERDKLSEKK